MRTVVRLVALVAIVTFARTARADNLDAALATNAPRIMQYLREHNCTSVGVFKFRVKKGNQAPSFKVGPLNANIALRLENALLLANDPKKPIGILHDADGVADERKLPNYAKPEGQRRLFEERFPLAWGHESVKPHTFLTGLVSATADMRRATVTIEAFDRDAADTSKVVTFDVPVDTPLLNDLGQGFQLSRSILKKKRSFEEVEDAAASDAAERDKTGQSPNTPSPAVSPSSPAGPSAGEKLIDLEIFFGDQKQEITSDPDNKGELRTGTSPREGQSIKIAFKNLTDETLGVVLMVNGVNSQGMEEGEPRKCTMWFPGAGERYEIRGFHMDKETVNLFRVLSDAEAEAQPYTENLGLISVYVFRAGKGLNIAPPGDDDKPASGLNISRSVSLRSAPRTAGARSVKPANFEKARTALEKQTGLSLRPGTKSRNPFGLGADKVESPTTHFSFPNPVQVMAMHIRYYKPKGR